MEATQKHLHAQKLYIHTELLHTDAFTHRSLFTELRDRRFDAERPLHRAAFTQTLLHRDAQSSFCTQTPPGFYAQKFLHISFTQTSFYTEKPLHSIFYRRKFRSQTSDNMERWKAEQGRGREKRKIRRKKSRRERVRRQKMQMREKVGKSRNTVFFQWFVAPEGRKVGSLKRRVRSQLARGEMKNCTPLWREAHFQVKMYKTHQRRTTFGSWDVEKVHAVVARSTFRSQNVQNTPASDHFWKLRCRKSARRCGAKHISKSKCTKHTSFGPLLLVEMSKKCTPLWREAHFEVKMYKTHHARTTFGGSDVEKVHAVVARSTFRSENVQNTRGSDHFWRFRCRFAASLHYTTLRYITPHSTILHYITLHYTPQHYNYNYTTRLHSTTLHYIKFHYTTLHYTTLHYTTLH